MVPRSSSIASICVEKGCPSSAAVRSLGRLRRAAPAAPGRGRRGPMICDAHTAGNTPRRRSGRPPRATWRSPAPFVGTAWRAPPRLCSVRLSGSAANAMLQPARRNSRRRCVASSVRYSFGFSDSRRQISPAASGVSGGSTFATLVRSTRATAATDSTATAPTTAMMAEPHQGSTRIRGGGFSITGIFEA